MHGHRIATALAMASFVLTPACGDSEFLTLTITDADSGKAMAGTLAFWERGGIYLDNPDPAKKNPHFVASAEANGDGIIKLRRENLKDDILGFHFFADGYRYGRKKAKPEENDSYDVGMEKHLSSDAMPTVANAALDPSTTAAGETITISAEVTAGDPCVDPLNPSNCDPLSDEVVLVDPDQGFAVGLAPPSVGSQGIGFPDGLWSSTFSAPDSAGTYTYYLLVSSEACVTSDRVKLSLVVE